MQYAGIQETVSKLACSHFKYLISFLLQLEKNQEEALGYSNKKVV